MPPNAPSSSNGACPAPPDALLPSRRTLLGTALSSLAAALVSPPAFALGESSQVDIAEIQLASGTTSRPEAWARLLYEVIQTTAVEVFPRAVQIAPDDPALFRHPFAVLLASGPLPILGEAAREQLQRYLLYGGFLVIDDVTGIPEGPVDASIRRFVSQVFPTRPLTILPSDHSVYRTFFLLHRPYGRVSNHGVLEGVTVGSMHPLLYFRDDLSGALDRSPGGADRLPCVPGGEAQRHEAIKLGVNLVLYALTSNYKQDQAHVQELIREGRLE